MKKKNHIYWLAALVLPCLHAQSVADPSGHWEGAIHAPFGEVQIEIDLAKNSKGEFAGTFSNRRDNLKGFPLANVAVEERSVVLLLRAGSGGGTFDGAVSANAQSLSGDFITAEGGFSVPFSLTRTGDAAIEPAPKSPPIAKELEGAWNGTMVADGRQMRLVLTMSNHPDGTATGSLADVDQGLEIPIATITQKASSLTFEVKAEGGSYSGALNREGTELAGTYTQGSAALPMTFRRADATGEKK